MTQSHLGVFNGGLATAAAKKQRRPTSLIAEAALAAPAPAREAVKLKKGAKAPAAAPAAAPADAAKSKITMTQFISAGIGDAMQDVLDNLRDQRGRPQDHHRERHHLSARTSRPRANDERGEQQREREGGARASTNAQLA